MTIPAVDVTTAAAPMATISNIDASHHHDSWLATSALTRRGIRRAHPWQAAQDISLTTLIEILVARGDLAAADRIVTEQSFDGEIQDRLTYKFLLHARAARAGPDRPRRSRTCSSITAASTTGSAPTPGFRRIARRPHARCRRWANMSMRENSLRRHSSGRVLQWPAGRNDGAPKSASASRRAPRWRASRARWYSCVRRGEPDVRPRSRRSCAAAVAVSQRALANLRV